MKVKALFLFHMLILKAWDAYILGLIKWEILGLN